MHALKTPSFLRPSSRASSPVPTTTSPRPDPAVGLEGLFPPSSRGTLNRLALTSRKRPITPTPSPAPTLVQDGSYLDALSLKLSEAVSKALTQPTGPLAPGEATLNGKRALPSGRGSALGALIASELEASAANSYLHRAIIRSLHRPLSVLLTSLSAQLLPLLSSPQFTAHPTPSAPSTAQIHAVAYATFAAELLQVFDARGLGVAENHGPGADNLRGVREGLESLISRVIAPLVHAIKNDVTPLVEALEHSPGQAATAPAVKQGFSHPKGVSAPLHPSIVALQNSIPAHARNLARYVSPPTGTSQTALATLLISVLWRSLVALAHRPRVVAAGAAQLPQLTTPMFRKKRLGSTTPPNTPPASRFSIKLPPSRPPSPPAALTPSAANDARALYDLLSMLPRPKDNGGRFALAHEAVDEAFGNLAALCALLDVETTGDVEGLDVITAELTTVIALPVLLRIFAHGKEGVSVAALLQLSEDEYRRAALSGFGRAEECGPFVAKRVLDALVEQHDAGWDPLVRWLEGRLSVAD